MASRKEKIGQLLFLVVLFFIIALLVGTIGYRKLAGLDWIDAFYNSAGHLSGSGPVYKMETPPQKLFASFYGMIAGLLLVGIVVYVVDLFVDLQFFGIDD